MQKLEWAIWFSQVPFDSLREGDWVNLRQDLYEFVSGAPDVASSLKSVTAGLGTWTEDREKLLSSENISTAQASLKKWFQSLAENRVFSMRPSVKMAGMMIRPVGASGYTIEMSPYQWQDRLYWALGHHLQLSRIIPGQIRICPECGRVFLRRKKPPTGVVIHCRHGCAQLAATRRYRDKKREQLKQKERERSRRRHVEKQRRRHGAKVKVDQRPRKRSP